MIGRIRELDPSGTVYCSPNGWTLDLSTVHIFWRQRTLIPDGFFGSPKSSE